MSWLATVGLVFGKTLAKSLIKSWLGEGFVNDFLGDGIGKGADQISTLLERPSVETLIARVAQNLKPIFNSESATFDIDSQKRVVFSLANTFTDVDSMLLVQLNLDSEAVRKNLSEKYPNITRDFSSEEESFYNRMLSEVCKALVKVAPKMDAFDYSWASVVLKNEDKTNSLIDRLMRIPNDADIHFENKYRQAVADVLDKVDFLGVGKIDDITHRQSLSVSYITLQVSANQEQTDEYSLKQSAKFLKRRSKYVSNLDNSSGDADQILAKGSRFIIRGQAGAGKTTLMHWLAVRSAKKDFPDSLEPWNNLIPFVIHLRDYSKSEAAFPKPEEFPLEVAEMVVGNMPVGWVHRQLESERALILVDGIDELPKDKRNEMLERLSQLVSHYPFNYYVITSRPTALRSQDWSDWETWVEEEEFLELAFQPMDTSRIEAFISRWHIALFLANIEKESDATSLANGLKRIVNRRPDLLKLAENPLLCAMLCALHHDRRENLPSDRRQLYKECIELLLERRDAKRKINLDIPVSLESKIKLLRYLAYWMMDNQYSRIEIDVCDERLAKKMMSLSKTKGVSSIDARTYFVERANLLREPVIGQIEFAHRSFQEYLAAQYAVLDERNFGALIKNAQDDQWRDIIILAIGEIPNRKDRDYILTQLLKLADTFETSQSRNKIRLIAAIGLEQGVESPTKRVQNAVIDAVKEVIPPNTSEEIDLLAAVGDSIANFLKYNDSYSESEMVSCIKTLSKIGTPKTLDLLEEYNTTENLIVKLELSRSWDSYDRQEYAIRILTKSNIFVKDTAILSWDGFETLTSLEDLRIWCDKNITDLGLLHKYKQLKKLSICWENLSDLKQIIGINSLIELNIGLWAIKSYICVVNTPLSDIALIKEIQNLKYLSIASTELKNVTSLSSLSELKSLKLMSEAEDLECLEKCQKLTELCINILPLPEAGDDVFVYFTRHATLANLPNFSNLRNLQRLSIGFSKNNNIEQIGSLENLSYLMLSNLSILDINALIPLENLRELHLSFLCIDNISALSHLKNLKKLYITSTRIRDLSPITDIENLEVLSIENCPVRNLEPIKSLKKLTKLKIKNVPAESIKIDYPLKGFSYERADRDSFFDIYNYIDTHPKLQSGKKQDSTEELNEIEEAMKVGEQADINFIVRRFRNIKRMSPELAEFAFETLKKPIYDTAEIIERVIRKITEDAEK